LAFPEWTEMQVDDRDAIQYLRLNELRDSINEILFPYLTTITPYFRMVSWLTWIFARLEYERIHSSEMSLRDYVNRALRYYGIFAVADVLLAQSIEDEHRGPIGVLAIKGRLAELESENIDFNHPTFRRPLDPTGIYKSSLVSMGLFGEKQQPISSRRYQPILIPTEEGLELADVFESKWRKTAAPSRLTAKTVWKKTQLVKLGKSINLQGLSSKDKESKLLLNAARSSIRNPTLYDDFVDIVTRTAEKCSKIDIYISSADIAKSALYRKLRIEDTNRLIDISLENSQATAILAYHELHTHMSYGADAILDGLANLARESSTGISIRETIKKANRVFKKKVGSPHKKESIAVLFRSIEKTFSKDKGPFQRGYPKIWGKLGFEKIQEEISESESNHEQIALGTIALLQSAACQSLFNPKWLLKVLPHHRDVFSAYTLLEEYEALPSGADSYDWIKSSVELITQKHDEVATSKGPYAKRVDLIGDKLFYRAEADFNVQRGRLTNAVLWLSDVGLLKGNQGLFTIGD